jgi:hypothetical protein
MEEVVVNWDDLCPALRGYWDEEECQVCWGCVMFAENYDDLS